MRILLFIYLVLTLAGPLYLAFSGSINFTANYMTANRESVKLAPDPTVTKEAIIQIYSARAFNWRGIFSVHTWIALKVKDSKSYTVLQVVGWRLFRGMNPVAILQDIPDRRWFDQQPHLLADIRGQRAEDIIVKIMSAAKAYPYPGSYVTWPGPNSNTFIADIARVVPELQLAMPSNAVGKDFLSITQCFSKAPSNTGYQFSLFGIVGIMIAKKEGLELNILGLVYGYSPSENILKLPGFGDIPLSS